ncbi:hypothetical protein [Pedobacter rhizosphaerae]|uniref:Uncharacterized protein n=1 Tax=Pedobacter rhizosphaerae TaxID=390241 RepID=A0A1H9LAF2_9SPHI|nr:hypothetical protein [Pedobacter rhizosphaerae]SER08481.1 hypothetical protein SAMN04488023_10467 [Pedobacter rhizosphaerae]
MKATAYEYLLNTVYYVELLQKQGINADMYLKMQQEHNKLSLYGLGERMESDFEFRTSFVVVRNYVQQAIKDGLKSFQFVMESKDVKTLSQMIELLNRNFFDKQSLDQIIEKANKVFSQYQLKN